MTKIVEYKNKDEETLYRFRLYAGVDEKTGKQRYIKRSGFHTKKQAQDELEKVKYEVKTGKYFKPNKRMRFEEVYKQWLEQYQNTVKKSTFCHTTYIIEKYLLPYIANVYVDKLTEYDCQQVINKAFKLCPSMINAFTSYIRSILDYARRLGLIKVNVASDIIKPKQKDKLEEKKKFYTRVELNKYLETAKSFGLKKYAFFKVLSFSGMRVGEVTALEWQDISFMSNTIRVNKTVARDTRGILFIQSPKTKASNRLINMDDETMEVLKELKNQSLNSSSHDLVFKNRKGGLICNATLRSWNKRISEKAELKRIKLHGFRHTHATLLLKSGVNIKDVQYRLGHSNIDTTLNIYAHVINDDNAKKIGKDFANYMKTDPEADPQKSKTM